MSEPISPLSVLSDAELDRVAGGGGFAEYTLIITLVAEAAVQAITTVGTKVTTNLTNTGGKL